MKVVQRGEGGNHLFHLCEYVARKGNDDGHEVV